ncbi:Crp/Fnr family transcriptional regulator [Fulvitalea axinellae]
MITEETMIRYGGQLVTIKKGAMLFDQDDSAKYYFQVSKGKVKMCNVNDEGKEFVQGIFGPGESFGEPPLFADFGYPAAAVALTEATLWRVEKNKFIELLLENPETHLEVTFALAKRLYYKSLMQREISQHQPERRILALIDYMKGEEGLKEEDDYEVPMTRQQVADMTGLRVETVIRTVKKLEKENELKIRKHKIVR